MVLIIFLELQIQIMQRNHTEILKFELFKLLKMKWKPFQQESAVDLLVHAMNISSIYWW